ncbi:MAG: ABC transporter permease [Bacteroidota bacterium]
MLRFVFKKLMYGFLVLFGVVTVIFFLFHAKPGDPARMRGGKHVDDNTIKMIERDLGLDLPIYQQYLMFLNDISPLSINSNNPESRLYLDTSKYTYSELFSVGGERVLVFKYPYFGRSYRTDRKVSDIIYDTLPLTMLLAFSAMIIATILGILLGIISALNQNTFLDNFNLVGSVLGMSLPSHYAALVIQMIASTIWFETTLIPQMPIYLFAAGIIFGIIFNGLHNKTRIVKSFSVRFMFELGLKGFTFGILYWFIGIAINGMVGYEMLPLIDLYFNLPGTDLVGVGSLEEVDDMTGEIYNRWDNLILPAITLGIRPLAIVMQLTRSSMLDVLSQDYIRTAKAKGVSEYDVIVVHALKNALNPVITAISGWFASLLAGAVFVENVFGWNGIGKEVFDSVFYDDFPTASGCVLVIAIFFVVINILVDIAYGILDPRIRLR